ncbi:glycine cleavage system protein H [Pedobacter yulinensis]|uniref:Glycine cleavage system protein H n=1 Tax=Pedobacter yulinensis TaxID=2126353 RepID=A0A2T3HQC6_9SPHI|nr:VanZ family protein [Pedobacter yulinensis]PST84648.1 glycine cleavage system protein H [Pedobacter yulinensis]
MSFGKALEYQKWSILWTIVILVLCNWHFENDGSGGFFFEGFDKLVHLGFFFILTVLVLYGKIVENRNLALRIYTLFKITFLTSAIGAIVEVLQWKIFTYRSADWWDLVCDCLGIGMGMFSYLLLHRAHLRQQTRPDTHHHN